MYTNLQTIYREVLKIPSASQAQIITKINIKATKFTVNTNFIALKYRFLYAPCILPELSSQKPAKAWNLETVHHALETKCLLLPVAAIK